MSARAYFDTIRSINFAAITNSYAVLGDPFSNMVRALCFVNTTDGDMMVTDDPTVQGKLVIPNNSFKLWDVQSNMNAKKDDSYVLPAQTQWYIKYITAPTEKDFYLEALF